MEAITERAFSASTCAHCGSALASGADDEFCCEGCRTVADLIANAGLGRYYALRNGATAPATLDAARDRQWLEPLALELSRSSGPSHLELDVQGLHCAACVWLIEQLFRRRAHGIEALVNPALGKISIDVESSFDLRAFADDIERFGYRLGPSLKTSSKARDGLLIRTGIAFGLAANAMMFALAIYLGLREGPLFELMRTLELALAALAVAIGAPVFVRGALEGLKRGMLHIDLPIALGMLLALAGTIGAYVLDAEAAYADTVAVFVALMLLGRWLQARAIARNRDRLLQSQGAGGLSARRLDGGVLGTVPASRIEAGDRLLIAPSEIAVVDAVLEDDAIVALDWISGESRPRSLSRGERIAAGAVNVGRSAIRARAESGFDRSPLESLLGRVRRESDEQASSSLFWDRVSRVYVLAVLAAASIAAFLWIAIAGDALRALEVATAILVVTCPCGIGIATPLAYELATSALRRRGLFVRRERALDRAGQIARIAFDKTGTLTTGYLELVDPSVLDALSIDERCALFELAARSAHPKSDAVRRALGDLVLREDVIAIEEPARGVRAMIDGSEYRLGAPIFARVDAAADLVFARDGRTLATLPTREVLRGDAAAEIAALESEGIEIAILSGDRRERVDAIAERLGVERAIAECTPDDKAAWLDAHRDAPTLFVGDGINDGPAADRAHLSGTPSIDRPYLPARTDFFFVTAGLAPIRVLVHASRALRNVSRRNLVIAAAYNAVAVSLAASGLMSPWLAAIAMPASSLAVIGATVFSLRESRWAPGSTRWKS
jgi:P-type Cu2+ transporter